ncbi:MAG: hypothetical protein H0W67_00425 [Gemmatimonadales bacterium]|nr:hypothetical protein [Gemmatimonadales bacterium]
MASALFYTADMVRAMPGDGNRYEVVYSSATGWCGSAGAGAAFTLALDVLFRSSEPGPP